MSKKDKVINNPDEHADSKKIQRWSVWTQGPKDAKETQRKFTLATPGQERDYKKLVGNRKFQRFEQVESVHLRRKKLLPIVLVVAVLIWHRMLDLLVRRRKFL